MRKAGLIVAVTVSVLAACDPGPAAAPAPASSRALAAPAGAGIVSAGQTRLDTLPVNHYWLEFDAAKAPELFPELAGVPAKLPAELWLDAAQRPARFAVEVPGPATGLKGTTTYHGWGEPLDIQAPPADQVVDAAEPLKKMGR